MTVVTELAAYEDEQGNRIEYSGPPLSNVRIKFEGANNRVVIGSPVRIRQLSVDFNCDNGLLEVAATPGGPLFSAAIRIGQDSTVRIGSKVTSTSTVTMSATEGTTITIGEDVMFATENQVRADDGHPIFDVRTGKRVNVSQSIEIGPHVWLGRMAVVLAGARIGSGTVIGYGSIVTGRIPNNCVAAGTPARVLRRDTAWERPHLSMTRPFYKPDASTIEKSGYWELTEVPVPVTRRVRVARRLRRHPAGRVLLRAVARARRR